MGSVRRVAGYLRRGDGLGGVTEAEMARLNGECYRGVVDEAVERVRRWEADVARVEWLMAMVGKGLRWLQPNRPGRLVVRWWKLRGGDRWRTPVLLRVVEGAGGVVLEKVGRKVKARGDGYFGTARGEVSGLIRVWWRLVDVREWLLGRLGGIAVGRVGRVMEVGEVMDELEAELGGLVELGRRRVAVVSGRGLWEADEVADEGGGMDKWLSWAMACGAANGSAGRAVVGWWPDKWLAMVCLEG